MKSLLILCCVTAWTSLSLALTPSSYLTEGDAARIKKVFISASPFNDVATAHYALWGLTLAGEKLPDADATCKFLNSKVELTLESIFHASTASKLLKTCKLTVAGAQQKLEAVLTTDYSLQDIYYAVFSLKNLNFAVDSAKVANLLTVALKKDDSVMNLAYAFHVSSQLQGDLTPFFERIEDVIVQADEVDGKYLQFEGGLGITSTTISGVYKLAEIVKKAPALTPDQAVKFTNYFLSRKFVQTVKGAAQLLNILQILSSNKFHIPVAMTLSSRNAVSTTSPSIEIRITNVLGASLGPLTVSADSAARLTDDTTIFSKKSFQAVKGSNILYSFNVMEHKPTRGFYKLTISATPTKADSRLVGNTAAQITVKVMTEVSVEGMEIGTVDRDQTTSAKSTSVAYPGQLSKLLEADFHQKVFMKFALKDNSAKAIMSAHQVFVQFVNKEKKQEIVFVAEADTNNKYRFDLDIYNKAKEFNYASTNYIINLIVGDAIVLNPFIWKVGEAHFSFPSNPNSPKAAENPFQSKPEIKHLFREQEKRPSTFVSNTFSVLVFLPLFVLVILWFKVGANVYNFPCSLYAVGFHLGLGAIFSLFTCFWMHLNMFATLKYMTGLCIATFLCGHKLLSRIANSKKS